jgi:hypothetical protein
MSVVVPHYVMQAVEEAAKRRRLTVPEFVEKALAAQSTAVLSDPYLEARAMRATGQGWKLLDEAPDAPPMPGDER